MVSGTFGSARLEKAGPKTAASLPLGSEPLAPVGRSRMLLSDCYLDKVACFIGCCTTILPFLEYKMCYRYRTLLL